MNPQENSPTPSPYNMNATPQSPTAAPQAVVDPGRGLAIASLVLWLLGLSLIGLICSVLSRSKTRRAGLPANTIATVGLVLNIVTTIISLGIILILITTTYNGIQQKARDSKRQVDISSLQTQLEGFYTANGYYPSLGDMNSTSWRSAHLKNLDSNSLADPSSPNTSTLAPSPSAKQYSYHVTGKSGESCENSDTRCAKYSLTATLDAAANGQTTATRTNLN